MLLYITLRLKQKAAILKTNKVAVLGYGSNGRNHISILNSLPNVQLCGIMGRDVNKLRNYCKATGFEGFSKISDCYLKYQPDYLVISVPVLQTYKVLIEALDFPWKILVEKPLGLNLEQTTKLIKIIQEKNRDVFVALNRRMLPSVLQLNHLLEKFDDSKRTVYVWDQQNTLEAKSNNHPKKVIENWQFANGIHLFDLGDSLCRGNITSTDTRTEVNGFEQIFNFRATYSTGDILIYNSVWNLDRRWSIEIKTDNHDYVLKPIESLKVNCDVYAKEYIDKLYLEPSQFKPGFYNQLKAFLEIEPSLEEKLCNSFEYLQITKYLDLIYRNKLKV